MSNDNGTRSDTGLHTDGEAFEHVVNLRDLGGIAVAGGRRVRHGVLYRSGALQWATPADLAGLRALGLRSVVDLRTAAELSERGQVDLDALPVDFHHHSLMRASWHGREFTNTHDPAAFLSDRYLEILDDAGDEIVKILHVIADDSSLPLLFHCAAGKDRTGVLAAVLLGLLGASDDAIVADYHRTAQAMERLIDLGRRVGNGEATEMMLRQPRAFLEAPAEAMERFLATVRTNHGSLLGWGADAGIGTDVLRALRSNLLTD